jgi:hypothetical protein
MVEHLAWIHVKIATETTCLAHLILPDLNTLIILDEE